jgi:RNA polymerase sigma-70 factor (ECF subfamily)
MNNNENDITLWERFREGDRESFVLIFKSYYSQLFNYGCRITNNTTIIEDTIQELFMDLFRTKGKAEIISFKAYLFKSFKFKLIKTLHKSLKVSSFLSEIHENEFEISHEMFMIINEGNRELSEKLHHAIADLSSRQKEIIYLKFHHDLGYEEVSEIMQINYQAARNLVYQAIKTLKSKMVMC